MKQKAFLIFSIIALIICSSSNGLTQGTWSADSSTGFAPNAYHTSSIVNGKIYVIGAYFHTLQVFDPSTHFWNTPITTGTFSAREFITSSVVNGKVYVFGGSDYNGNTLNTLEVFDPLTDVWTTPSTTGIFSPRIGPCSSVVNGKIYVFGGNYIDNVHEAYLNTVEVFDPATNSWTTPSTTGVFTKRAFLTSSVVDGKIYVIGGDSGAIKHLNTLEVFDPSTNTWSTPKTTGTFTARSLLTSAVVNGKIYVIGGSLNDHIVPCNILEVFDPSTNAWSTPLTSGSFTPRFGLSSNVFNEKIYILAGYTPHTPLNYVDVFTPGAANAKTEQVSPDISLSPNPTTGIISVHNAPANILHVTITNILGESVIELAHPNAPEFTLDLSKLPPGTYFARFSLANEVVTRKILKE